MICKICNQNLATETVYKLTKKTTVLVVRCKNCKNEYSNIRVKETN